MNAHNADYDALDGPCRGCILGRFYPHDPGCPDDQGETVSIGGRDTSPPHIPPAKTEAGDR